MKLESVILLGVAASRPAANTVPKGSLYYSTDTGVLERSNSATWDSYSSGGGISQLTGDVTAGPGTGSQVATIAAAAVTATKLDALAVQTAKIDNSAVTTAKIADDNVTYAKLQNVSVTARILGRKTAGAGDTEECTLSEILDFVGSAAQGDILYRGASGWVRLAAGTSGQILKTLGAAADPAWSGDVGNTTFSKAAINGTIDANAVLKIVGQYYAPLVEKGNSGTALTLNWNDGNEQATTLNNNCTFTLSNPVDGGRYVVIMKQDGTGSRVPTFPGTVSWSNNNTTPTWSTTASRVDIVTMVYRAGDTKYYADASIGHT